MNKIKLFCFPYAGGSAMIYNRWKPFIDSRIELIPIELAGRGRRIHEGLYKDVKAVVDDVFYIIREDIKYSPYSIFGHSMGAMISYELAQKIKNSNLPSPEHIFFSGRSAPHLEREDEKKYHLMDDDRFKKEVLQLGGTPPEFFEHPELLQLFLPLLKNDFRISESELSTGVINPLNVNFTVFLGKDEDLTSAQCDGWKKHTDKLCSIHYFEGGHFFLHDETDQIVRFINNTLCKNIYSKRESAFNVAQF